jgi:hypothetical protein
MPDSKISKWIRDGIKSGFIKKSFNEPLVEDFNKKNFPDIFIDPEGNKLNLMGGGDRGQKKLVKELEESHGLKSGIAHGLLGQKIYYLDPKNIVEIRGEPAYILEFRDNQKEQRLTVAMRDSSGVPRKISFDLEDVADDISGLRRERRQESVEIINKVLSEHNKAIERVTDRGGVQTLPLRFNSVIKNIEARLSELNSQIQHYSEIANENYKTPQIEEMREQAIQESGSSGSSFFANTKNIVTALLNMYSGREEDLISDIDSGKFNMLEEIAIAQAKRYAQSILEKYKNTKIREEARDTARQERIEDVDLEIETPDTPLPELSIEDIPLHTPEKAMGFKSDSARKSQAIRAMKSIEKSITELGSVKDASIGLQGFIASLSGATENDLSQLSRAHLSDPDNKFDVDSMRSFVDTAKLFFRRYQVDVWSKDGLPDKAKLGKIGVSGVGNFIIALELKKVTTAFDVILKSYAGNNF